MKVVAHRLPSGYWHVRGPGPCNWSQPPRWPCDPETLRQFAFPEASDQFLHAAIAEADSEARAALEGE